MSEKLFDALEICLNALEQGETVDAALVRFPALADELRPILEASLHARQLAGPAVPSDVQRRGRARLLQHASQMREAKRAPRRTWVFNLRPLAVTLMLVVFFLSGTQLVRASAATIPGDNLYPVKRTWEDVRLLFATDDVHRENLELEYETERVEEISELLAEGRSETVSFTGYVTAQTDGQWTVAGIPVIVGGTTNLPNNPIAIGDAVMVIGNTDAQGFLVAQKIDALAPGAIVPAIGDHEDESEGNGAEKPQNNNGGEEDGGGVSGPSSGDDANESGSDDSKSKWEGVVENMNGHIWTVNGQVVDVTGAEIIGAVMPGARILVEGYYDANGVFIATRVVFSTSGGSGDSGSSGNANNDNSDDDSNDNDEDDNDNDSNNNDEDDNDTNDNDTNDNDSNDNDINNNDD